MQPEYLLLVDNGSTLSINLYQVSLIRFIERVQVDKKTAINKHQGKGKKNYFTISNNK